MFTYTVEAILFNGDEGKLEDLTKAEIDALPETPYKYFQLRRYAYANANSFGDIAFLYQSGEVREEIRRQANGEIKNFFPGTKRMRMKKILIAVRTNGDKILIIYEQDFKMPDGTLSDKSFGRYLPLALGKENDKWLEVKINQTPDVNAIWNWSWFAYNRKKASGTPMSKISSEANALFLNQFKEVN